MFFNIRKFLLLFILVLLQSCSGGSIGNFFELSFENLENNKKNIDELQTEDNLKNVQEEKKVFRVDKKINNKKINKKEDKLSKTRNNQLQSYKIIFILKDVDPKDPIGELSNILRNSQVNYEIEKIERFLDSKNKTIKKN